MLYPLYPLFRVNYDKIAKLTDSFNPANLKNRHVSNRIRRMRRSALTRTNRWITRTRSDSEKLTTPNNSEFIAEMLSDWDTRSRIIDLYIYPRDLAVRTVHRYNWLYFCIRCNGENQNKKDWLIWLCKKYSLLLLINSLSINYDLKWFWELAIIKTRDTLFTNCTN